MPASSKGGILDQEELIRKLFSLFYISFNFFRWILQTGGVFILVGSKSRALQFESRGFAIHLASAINLGRANLG